MINLTIHGYSDDLLYVKGLPAAWAIKDSDEYRQGATKHWDDFDAYMLDKTIPPDSAGIEVGCFNTWAGICLADPDTGEGCVVLGRYCLPYHADGITRNYGDGEEIVADTYTANWQLTIGGIWDENTHEPAPMPQWVKDAVWDWEGDVRWAPYLRMSVPDSIQIAVVAGNYY